MEFHATVLSARPALSRHAGSTPPSAPQLKARPAAAHAMGIMIKGDHTTATITPDKRPTSFHATQVHTHARQQHTKLQRVARRVAHAEARAQRVGGHHGVQGQVERVHENKGPRAPGALPTASRKSPLTLRP